jgi:hypothetical protein
MGVGMVSRKLLVFSTIAGPIYLVIWLLQIFVRVGYDPTRQDLSLLSNGQLGWIQIVNFLVSGLFTVVGALGMRRVLTKSGGRSWESLLLLVYGLGLIGAGIFVADPMNGFPPGTPNGPPINPTMSGTLHIVAGAIGFLSLIASCFIFAHKFRKSKQTGWTVFSMLTGVIFLGAFFGIASSSQLTGTAVQTATLIFSGAVVLSWSWITAVSLKLRRE